jgi:hypothetical protein
MLTNEPQILSGLLFDVRNILATLKGVDDLVQHDQIQLPDDVVTWLNRWRPTYQAWSAEEMRLRAYCRDSRETSLDWEKLITEFGERLEQVTDVWSEAQMLNMPKEHEAERLVGAVIHAVSSLNRLYHVIASGEYKQFWNETLS